MQVIRTRLVSRGNGTEQNPHRYIEQFWDMDGRLLAERDPFIEDRPGGGE